MKPDRVLPHLGALSCLGLAVVLSVPYFTVSGQSKLLAAYYGAGPLGVAGAIFLAVLGSVIFLSGVRGQADPTLVAGIMVAVGVTIFGVTALWTFLVEPIVFSFPSQYAWLDTHRWLSLGLSLVLAALAAGNAAVTID